MKRRMTDCRPEVMQRMGKYLENYDYNILEMDSGKASEKFEDGSLDCVYIDAGHDYRNVKADLNYWYPKVKSEGIFSGHDFKEVGVTGVRTAYANMKSIDDRNIFESDDEVGAVFGELADVVYYLKDVIDFVESEPIIQTEDEIEPTQE